MKESKRRIEQLIEDQPVMRVRTPVKRRQHYKEIEQRKFIEGKKKTKGQPTGNEEIKKASN
jgi:hypothetical protein